MGSNYAAPMPKGSLHHSGGANVGYPEGEIDEKVLAGSKGVNLSLQPVTGSASSSRFQGHKRTSSVTNNTSSGGTGSLVHHGSGGNIHPTNSSGARAPSSVASS
jgi:hypothetical protein